TVQVTGTGSPDGHGSAGEVILGYPHAIARCTSSSLMPRPYGMRGGWRATFSGVVLEYAMRAGFTGQGPATLTEVTAEQDRPIDLPDAGPPYAAVIDHLLAPPPGPARHQTDPAQ